MLPPKKKGELMGCHWGMDEPALIHLRLRRDGIYYREIEGGSERIDSGVQERNSWRKPNLDFSGAASLGGA
jgi:hypothetical protein